MFDGRNLDDLPESVQPPIMLDEFVECEEAVKRSPAFREALRKRGVEDVNLVMVDPWSAGVYGNERPEDLRHIKAGTKLYGCSWGLVMCSRVGKIKATIDGEVQDIHPHDQSVQRGIMVEI